MQKLRKQWSKLKASKAPASLDKCIWITVGGIVTIVCCPCILYVVVHRRLVPAWRKKRMQKKNRTPPKLSTPGKDWTEPGSTRGFSLLAGHRKKKIMCEQEESPFFARLPLELRTMVYDEYFGAGMETVVALTGYTRKFNCWRNLPGHGLVPRSYEERDTQQDLKGPEEQTSGVDVLNLVLTCKKIYTEAIGPLYSRPIYTCFDPWSLLAFSSSITPPRLKNLRNITLDFHGPCPYAFAVSVSYPMERHGCVISRHIPPGPYIYHPASYRAFHAVDLRQYNDCLPLVNPPMRFHRYRLEYDCLTYWDVICEVLRKMEGLKELRVMLPREETVNKLDERLRPLEKVGAEGVSGMQRFVAGVDWGDGRFRRWRRVVSDSEPKWMSLEDACEDGVWKP
ncbi:hypothetical protein CC78DRAFT_567247 [Lojkania enalia]|uniref:DUF7730 domain-containing protein n=1 Tax=Lojkania enalia TaxID=147567 RepID=A0A9P4KAZ6_9PLEO|nr:hypothetical protein CC78DRAFT_567247 [Didymosphaeria enalia]